MLIDGFLEKEHAKVQLNEVCVIQVHFIIISSVVSLSIIFRSNTSIGVCDTNGKLFGTFNNGTSDSARDGFAYRGGISTVVHHEHFQFIDIVYHNGLETVRVHVTCFPICTVTDARHGNCALESTTNASINTLGLSP